MIKLHYNKTLDWIDCKRYHLLLLCTVMVLVLPAFSGTGRLSELLFWATMTFLFIQSLIAARIKRSRKILARSVVIILVLLTFLKPIGIESVYIDILKNVSFSLFFIYVVFYLFKFINESESVNLNVLVTSVNIYLLLGIIGGSLASLLSKIYTDAYNFPAQAGIEADTYVQFQYYSFITMTTVGYGDITPRIPESRTLAYFLAITGQLYVAIIIAFIVGKLMAHAGDEKVIPRRKRNEQKPD